MPLNGSAPTNKRNGLAISRIDGEDCFIRDDKPDRAGRGRGWRGREAVKAVGGGEEGTGGGVGGSPETVTRAAADTPSVTHI